MHTKLRKRYRRVLQLIAGTLSCCLMAPAVVAQPTSIQPGAPSQPAQTQTQPQSSAGVKLPNTMELTLDNGLHVIVLEDHSYPVASCLAWYRVGARNESPGSTGVTHLLEHLLFGSTTSFRKGQIAAAIARSGGQFNGYTSDDFTTFFETLPAQRLELALKVESERMRGASFTDADVQEEIANIQQEFENELNDGNGTLSKQVRAMLYLTHPYHNPTMGWRADVDNLNSRVVRDYYDKYFWPDNCTIVLAGDVQPAAAQQLVRKYFASLPKAPQPVVQPRIAEPAQHGERRIIVKYPGKQEALQVAYHGPAFVDADVPAMLVLEKLLNAPYAGRLKTQLVDTKVCSSAVSSFEVKKDPGYFSITCNAIGGAQNSESKILDELESLVSQLRVQPVSDVELKRARNQAEMAFYSEQDGPYRAGFNLGYFDTLSSWHMSGNWSDRLRSVSAADIQRVVKRYFVPDNRVVAWLSGSAAAHVPTGKAPADSGSTKTPAHQLEHTRLTGYKTDDNALAPGNRAKQLLIAQATPPLAVERDEALGQDTEQMVIIRENKRALPIVGKLDKSGQPAAQKAAQSAAEKRAADASVQRAIQDIPSALPAAVKELPAAIGGAPAVVKELPNAVEKVPAVIKNLPSAIQGLPSVIKQLPSAVGSIPSAIKELPGAIGGLPGAAASAVKELPGAIGGLPGAAVNTIKELPGTVVAIPGAAASALKGMPAALGNVAVQVGTIPGAVTKQLNGNRAEFPIFRRVLKNGMTLVVFESHLSPIVQITGAVHAGTAYDAPGKPGTSKLATALLNNGTARRGHLQILTQQEDMGLAPNQMLQFATTADTIQFGTSCLSRDASAQFDLIAETLNTPAISDGDLERARQDLISQLKQSEDSGQDKASRALLRSLLAPTCPFLPEDPNDIARAVPGITATDVRKYVATHIVPAGTTLVIAGDIDPERAVQLAEHSFAAWAGKGPHQRLHVHPNSRHVLRTAVPSRDKSRTVIGFGQLLPITKAGPEFGNLLIADAVLSKHPTIARFSQKLASQPALLQALNGNGVDTDIRPLSNALAWSCVATVEPSSVPLAVQMLQSELRQLATNGINADELAEVKRYLLGALPVHNMCALSSTADTLLQTCIHGDDGEGFFTELNSIRAATIEGVNKTIRTALRPDHATLVIVGPSQSIRSVRNQVAAQTTVVPPVATDQSPASAPQASGDDSAANAASASNAAK